MKFDMTVPSVSLMCVLLFNGLGSIKKGRQSIQKHRYKRKRMMIVDVCKRKKIEYQLSMTVTVIASHPEFIFYTLIYRKQN